MEFQNKVLKCVECGSEFVFSAGEQSFYHERKFKNQPKRCRSCKAKRVALSNRSSSQFGNSGTQTQTSCSQCGRETVVPFRPSQGRPVLCKDCFMQKRRSAQG